MQISVDGIMPIPCKKKDTLVTFGLVGRIHLESDWTADEVKPKSNLPLMMSLVGTTVFYSSSSRLQGQDQSPKSVYLLYTNGHPEKLQVMQIIQ